VTVHILRPLVPHLWGQKSGFKTVGEVREYVQSRATESDGLLGTWTSRWPKRADELRGGGSVYFVHKRETVFRLPIAGVIRCQHVSSEYGRLHRIYMRTEFTYVRPQHVGMVRGWRYLEDEDAPPDLAHGNAGMPDEALAMELAGLGLA